MNDIMLREAIESQVAPLLAQSKTGERLKKLLRQADAVDDLMQQGDPDSQEGMELHAELHLGMARLTGFPLLAQELGRVWTRTFMQFAWVGATVNNLPPDWHRSLILAIGSGDVLAADAATRYHVRRSPEEFDQFLQEQQQAIESLRARLPIPEDEGRRPANRKM